MRRNYTYIIALLLLFIVSCQQTDQGVYYDLYINDNTYPVSSLRLFENGTYIYYRYNRSTDERYFYDEDDVIRGNRWSRNKDTINVDGTLFLVLKVTNDSLLIRSINADRRLELRKSKRQENE